LVDKLDLLRVAQDKLTILVGGMDPYRITLATGGRGYFLNPRQNDGPLNYFMYPYAEVKREGP